MTWADVDAGDWLELSARLQRFVASRSGHSEVIVRIAPKPTDSVTTWPSGYQPGIAEVLIDAREVLDVDDRPGEIDPGNASDRAGFPVLTGWACLAAAHVAHTAWPIQEELQGAEATIGRGLEQARVCAPYLVDHPADRRWLRAAALSLFSHSSHQDFLGLIALSRAGILLATEVDPVLTAFREWLPSESFDRVLDLVDESIGLADGDIDRLVGIAHEITAALGLSEPKVESEVAGAMSRTMREVARNASSHTVTSANAGFGSERSAEADFRIQERTAALGTFGRDLERLPAVRRAPDAALRGEARALLSRLRAAQFRAPQLEVVPSGLPPGRLRLAEAMRMESQRAAGARLTAKPWRQLRRHPVDLPRLKVGLSWDISASRADFNRDMADLAWAIAWAVTRLQGEVAAVAWNSATVPVVWPGRIPTEVVEPNCGGGSSACPQSLRALSGALRLDQEHGARLVIVMTDLRITNRRFVQVEVDRLRDHGVPVLWLTGEPDAKAPRGAHPYPHVHGKQIASTVGQALVGVLQDHYDSRELA